MKCGGSSSCVGRDSDSYFSPHMDNIGAFSLILLPLFSLNRSSLLDKSHMSRVAPTSIKHKGITHQHREVVTMTTETDTQPMMAPEIANGASDVQMPSISIPPIPHEPPQSVSPAPLSSFTPGFHQICPMWQVGASCVLGVKCKFLHVTVRGPELWDPTPLSLQLEPGSSNGTPLPDGTSQRVPEGEHERRHVALMERLRKDSLVDAEASAALLSAVATVSPEGSRVSASAGGNSLGVTATPRTHSPRSPGGALLGSPFTVKHGHQQTVLEIPQPLIALTKFVGFGDEHLKLHAVIYISQADLVDVAVQFLRDSAVEEGVPAVGMDAEWKDNNPISLLQLCTRGLCVLFHLSRMAHEGEDWKSQPFPPALQAILEDRSILKVGVGIGGDKRRIAKDWRVHMGSCIDLVKLVHMVSATQHNGELLTDQLGLKGITRDLLGIELPKLRDVATGDWEAEQLDAEQVKYASDDAFAALYVYLQLYRRYGKASHDDPANHFEWCRHAIDVLSVKGAKKKATAGLSPRSGGGQRPGTKKPKAPVDPNLPCLKGAYYNNVMVHGKSGKALFTCDDRKANWYLAKGLANCLERTSDSDLPARIQLTWDPTKRVGTASHEYYTAVHKDQCVICSKGEGLIRHYIVPPSYRKYFDDLFKSHNSHDIVLVCAGCHPRVISICDDEREMIAKEYEAPLNTADGAYKDVFEGRRALKAVDTLLRNAVAEKPFLPDARRRELAQFIEPKLDLFLTEGSWDKDEVVELREAVAADGDVPSEYLSRMLNVKESALIGTDCCHTEVVMRKVRGGGRPAQRQFVVRWRMAFMRLKPKFLPTGWQVEFNDVESTGSSERVM